MTERESLKLALEALKQIDAAMPFPVAKSVIRKAEEALAQKEQEPLTGGDQRKHIICLCPDCTKPAQPEQEPVAHSVVEPLRHDEYQRRVSVKWINQPVAGPLYTTPPQRTWVGLTEEERHSALFDKDGMALDYEDYAWAVEAKLKEKNT